MELTLVPLLLPAIQRQFGLSISELAWVFNAYGVAVAFGVLLGGLLGDIFSAKRVFGLGVFFFASGSSLVAVANGFESIIGGRILQGFGGGVFSPLVPILLTRASPERPGRVLIIWGSVAGYVAALAPLLYGSVLAAYGWNLAFILFAVVSVVALIVVHSSHIGADPSAHLTARPIYSELLRSRDLWVMFIYVFCTYGPITFYLFRLPLWLAESNFELVSIGFVLSLVWLSFSVLSTLLRNWVDAPHVRVILLAAPVLIALSFPFAYFCDDSTCVVLSAILVGSGLACSNAPSTQLVLKFAPRGTSAVSASFDITFARLGGVVTVAFLAQSNFGFSAGIVALMSVAAFACALIATGRAAELARSSIVAD